MTFQFFSTIRRLALLPASCLLPTLLLAGCTSPPQKLMGDGFHDEMSGWGEKNRPADDASGDFSGVSTKSQQVERDLGVR